jgi:hypothetical protein
MSRIWRIGRGELFWPGGCCAGGGLGGGEWGRGGAGVGVFDGEGDDLGVWEGGGVCWC